MCVGGQPAQIAWEAEKRKKPREGADRAAANRTNRALVQQREENVDDECASLLSLFDEIDAEDDAVEAEEEAEEEERMEEARMEQKKREKSSEGEA